MGRHTNGRLAAAWLGVVSGLACFSTLIAASGLGQAIARLPRPDERPATYPFADGLAARRLRALLAGRLKLPHLPRAGGAGMGWRWPDPDYYRQIPFEARKLPTDWSRLPGTRFRNTELGGIRDIRLSQTPSYDQWLLTDPKHHLRACIAVERQTRTAYFFEVGRTRGKAWQRAPSFDNCFECHPSGPRLVHTVREPYTDGRVLERFNRIMLGYGACDLWGSDDTKWRGKPWADERCVVCHDGSFRGRLYTINRDPIVFKTQFERSMPRRSL